MARIIGTTLFAMLFVLPVSLAAQGRGNRGGPARNGQRPQAAPASIKAPAPPFVYRAPSPVGRTNSAGRYHQQVLIRQPLGAYSPYWFSPATYSPFAYAEPTYAPVPAVETVVVNHDEAELRNQVRRLSQEVEQLRVQQAVPTAPPVSQQRETQSSPRSPTNPAILVFLDGHRLAIQSYALMGQTLWVLDAGALTKISIADLDTDATQKENRGRTLRFLPSDK